MALAGGVALTAAVRRAEVDHVRHRAGSAARKRPGLGVSSARWLPAVRPIAAAVVAWPIAGGVGSATGLAAAVLVPRLIERRRAARRAEALDEQLSDAVASIAAGLRAGMSVLTALANAATDVGEPLASFLRAVVARADLGVPMSGSLARFSQDVGTPGARLVATALALHHRDGGDGPGVLDRLADTLRQRADGEREIRSLTAQARLSGTILGLLPIAFFLFLVMTSREDLATAYRTPAGAVAIVAGVCMQGTAFLWIRHLLRVDA
jgi:tight adherence protein B